jgi:hypothetical protein
LSLPLTAVVADTLRDDMRLPDYPTDSPTRDDHEHSPSGGYRLVYAEMGVEP